MIDDEAEKKVNDMNSRQFLCLLMITLVGFSHALVAVAISQQNQQVCLLVRSSLSDSLRDRLDRWKDDVEKTGFDVIEKVISSESANQIRTWLQNLPSLAGCLLVGDIPYVIYATR